MIHTSHVLLVCVPCDVSLTALLGSEGGNDPTAGPCVSTMTSMVGNQLSLSIVRNANNSGCDMKETVRLAILHLQKTGTVNVVVRVLAGDGQRGLHTSSSLDTGDVEDTVHCSRSFYLFINHVPALV